VAQLPTLDVIIDSLKEPEQSRVEYSNTISPKDEQFTMTELDWDAMQVSDVTPGCDEENAGEEEREHGMGGDGCGVRTDSIDILVTTAVVLVVLESDQAAAH
jgi:hypothetical protein